MKYFTRFVRQRLRHSNLLSQVGSLIGLGLLAIVGCQSLHKSNPSLDQAHIQSLAKQSQSAPIAQAGEITFMSYNVENLFDTHHDAGKSDWEYLPLSEKSKPEVIAGCKSSGQSYQVKSCLETDWNESILKIKMQQLAGVFKQVHSKSQDGKDLVGPDIATLMEVENISVLKKFASEFLSEANYQTVVLIEGEDRRGIDVGVVSRFPLAGTPELKLIEFTPTTDKNTQWQRPLTRGLLIVPLRMPNGTVLKVVALHFPSQANPTQERLDAIRNLNRLAPQAHTDNSTDSNTETNTNSKSISKQDTFNSEMLIAAGDTNITAEEDAQEKIFSQLQNDKWTISHLVGCKTCEGTHNYRGNWSFLDVLFFSKSLDQKGKASYQFKPESIQTITTAPDQVTKGGRPKRFDDKKGTGISDHLPIFVILKPRI